jgi:hypothetical protein
MGYAEIVRENASIRPPETRSTQAENKDEVPNKKRGRKWA